MLPFNAIALLFTFLMAAECGLADPHEEKEGRNVDQSEAEQFPGGVAVPLAIKPPAQVAERQVQGQGVDSEGPCSDPKGWSSQAHGRQQDAVAESHSLAQPRVHHRHHAVASARVVWSQIPAKGVEVGELP